MNERITVVIPAYESELTIGTVVAEILRIVPTVSIVVVDDGSSDGTAEAARRAGAVVVVNEVNKGVGGALKAGFRHAVEGGAEIIVTLGADRQRDPNEIPFLVECLLSKNADCVVGSKYLRDQHVPNFRKIGAKVIGLVFNLLFNRRDTDILSGFRAIKSHCLHDIESLHNRYPFDADLRIHFVRKRFSVIEIPVTVYYHKDSTRMRSSSAVGFHILIHIIRRRLEWIFFSSVKSN